MKQWCLFTSQVRTRIPAEGMGSRTAYRIAFIQYHIPKCLNMSGCDTVHPTHSFNGKVPLGRSSHKTPNPCVSKLRPHRVSQEVGFTSEFCLLLSMSVWVFPYSLLMKINLFFFFGNLEKDGPFGGYLCKESSRVLQHCTQTRQNHIGGGSEKDEEIQDGNIASVQSGSEKRYKIHSKTSCCITRSIRQTSACSASHFALAADSSATADAAQTHTHHAKSPS